MPAVHVGAPEAAADIQRCRYESPIRAAQHSFRTLLTALATPGSVNALGIHPTVAQAGPVGNPWLASALVALLDHEVSLAVEAGPDRQALADLLHRRTRTLLSVAEEADFVVGHLPTLDPALLGRLKRGSLHYPDDSVTLLIEVSSLAPTQDSGAALALRGPGVNGARLVWLPGVSDALLVARDAANQHYPMGIDIFVFDGAGQVMGLPRTSELARWPAGAA